MAGYHRYTAVLDACVLYPAPLRDLLLSLAAKGYSRRDGQTEFRMNGFDTFPRIEETSIPKRFPAQLRQ